MTTADAAREEWIDVAKGIAIILVVLFHAVIFPAAVGLAGVWETPAALLDTFRMPLFFFTAGIFARRAVSRPPRLLFGRRIAHLLWVYVLWTTIWLVISTLLPIVPASTERPSPVLSFVTMLVWPNANTWFLYALAVFLALAWLLRNLHPAVTVCVATAVALLFGTNTLDTGSDPLDKMGMYWLYFVIALVWGDAIRRVAPRTGVRTLAVITVLYLAALLPAAKWHLLDVPGVRILASLLAIAFGANLAICLSRWSPTRRLAVLGRNTLPIYVLHFYPVLAFVAIIAPVAAAIESWAWVIPPLLTVVAIAASLGFHRATRTHLRWLYELPTARHGVRT